MGANQIVMGTMGELTQVDPSTRTAYTPPNPLAAGQTLLVSVEDLRAYFEFFSDQVKVPEASMTTVIDLLRKELHPLAIGQVHRLHGAIRYIAESLLGSHIDDPDKVKRIAEAMVTDLYIHSHKIKQPEAERIGLPAVLAPDDVGAAMWSLWELYEADMHLREPIRASNMFPDQLDQWVEMKDQPMVYVESAKRTDVYKVDVLLSRALQGIQPQKAVIASPGLAPGAPAPAVQVQRPIWGPQVSFTTERESWSVE